MTKVVLYFKDGTVLEYYVADYIADEMVTCRKIQKATRKYCSKVEIKEPSND